AQAIDQQCVDVRKMTIEGGATDVGLVADLADAQFGKGQTVDQSVEGAMQRCSCAPLAPIKILLRDQRHPSSLSSALRASMPSQGFRPRAGSRKRRVGVK